MKTLVERTLEVARSRIGTREIGHSNTGPEVSKWLRRMGAEDGSPWCAAFLFCAIDDAALSVPTLNPFLRSAYTPDVGNWAEEHKILIPCHGRNGINLPEVGDAFLVRGAVRFHHIGVVRTVTRRSWGSIEGNSNSDGSREGYEVAANDDKPFASRFWWVRWGALCADAVPIAKLQTRELYLGGHKVFDLPVAANVSLCPVRKWCAWMRWNLQWVNSSETAIWINGHALESDISIIDNEAYVPVRDLVALNSMLTVRFDAVNQHVLVDLKAVPRD